MKQPVGNDNTKSQASLLTHFQMHSEIILNNNSRWVRTARGYIDALLPHPASRLSATLTRRECNISSFGTARLSTLPTYIHISISAHFQSVWQDLYA